MEAYEVRVGMKVRLADSPARVYVVQAVCCQTAYLDCDAYRLAVPVRVVRTA